MTGESRGAITNDGAPELNFTGINDIWNFGFSFDRQARMTYDGSHVDTNMTVRAGDWGDTFIGGAGDEIFWSGRGHDHYVFAFNAAGMGHDRIVHFGQTLDPGGSDWTFGLDDIEITGAAGRLHATQTEHVDDATGATSRYHPSA